MREKLKPCPFCGSEDVIVTNPKLEDVFSNFPLAPEEVLCSNCGAGITFCYSQKSKNLLTDKDIEEMYADTVRRWNQRAEEDGNE